MMVKSTEGTTIVTTINVSKERELEFFDWKSKFNACITAFPGLISLEILSPVKTEKPIWTLIQRFSTENTSSEWLHSQVHQSLLEELKQLLGPNALQEIESGFSSTENGVTEVFVIQVSPDKEEAFRTWIAKMNQAEATFPGFRGMYVQAPSHAQGRNWLTFLHFDTTENLDRWLSSDIRKSILQESESLIASLESHRVISPYIGWFANMEKGPLPSINKPTMLILLVLFPIVMLEIKFLPWITGGLNSALATFIANSISVSLISWPFLPLAIFCLNWWLAPTRNVARINILGTLLVFGLYLLEIAIFWNLL
jgi:antibiotic biosynthesis monooxygenase (ABM) superfamily enzyme